MPPGRIATLPLEKWNGSQAVIAACLVIPPAVPMMIADWAFVTLFVVTANLALADPVGTVALGGTVAAAGLSLDSDTTKPPEGAAALSLSVPVAPLGRISAENAAQLRADAAAAIACLQSSSA